MKKFAAAIGIATVALVLAAPAQAGVSEDFAGCDGLKKPKRSDDGMRGEATISGWRFGTTTNPQKTIDSCDRAFESGKLLPEQTLRRAHMMRARAAARLELGDAAGALADLDAAQAAGKEYAGDYFYERSMGVSMDLLRAIALNDTGKRDEALLLAEAAAAKRPYALEVQRTASMLRAANGETASDSAIWAELAKIDPATRSVASSLVATAQDLAAVAAAAGEPVITLPEAPSMQQIALTGGNATALISAWIGPVGDSMRTAYALASTGENEAARAWVEETRKALTPGNEEQRKKAGPLGAALADMARSSVFEPTERLVEARIAVSEGRLADAAGMLEGKTFRSSPVTDDLWSAYSAAAQGVEGAPSLPELGARPERKAPSLASMAENLLMRPESERKLIDYQKSRPNILGALVGGALSLGTSLLGGVPRTAGFKETENADGSIMVEYTGNTTSGAVVQEMTLLRAAEVAQAAGKTHFHIGNRKDYQRYLTQMMYGVEQSRTLTGYKTELTVTLLDGADVRPDALDAVAVIDALGPVYYGD